ncbi:DUF6297 family protein [Paenarthrobacter ilicis]|uniref:DUF6297 family protein n=1 Tax=Paenarthrobacter ilicis TaxID=43665 RepID=UPI003008F6A6
MVISDQAPGSRTLATDIVRFTRRSARQYRRSRISLADRFIDLYSWGLGLGVSLTIAAAFVLALRNEIAARQDQADSIIRSAWFHLPEPFLWTSVTFVVLLAVSNLARKLGPLMVNGPEGAWWLPLPVDRGPMVLPPFLRHLALTAAAAIIGYFPFSLVTSVDRSIAEHALATLTFGASAMIAVLLAAAQQLGILPSWSGRAITALILAGLSVLPLASASGWPAAAGGMAAVVLLALVARRAGEVGGLELMRGGAVAGHAGASLFLMDSNEVLRALNAGRKRPDGGRAAAFFARPTRTPFRALVRADIVAFLRLSPPLLPPVLWLVGVLAVLLVNGGLPVFVQLAIIVIAGCATASGMGTVARKTAMIPEVDALLPLHPALVRVSRMVMPCMVMALWTAVLATFLVILGAADAGLVLVGALAGAAMGAGSLRAATRTQPDWTAPPVETPFGPVPRAQLGSLVRGLDVTILAMIPLLLALYLGAVPVTVMLVQGVFSAGIIATVALSRPKQA